MCPRARVQFEMHGCIPDGQVTGQGEEFSVMTFCDGAICVHMPPTQSFAHAYMGNTGPSTDGMGCFSGGGPHNGLLAFLGEADVTRATNINEHMTRALTKTTGAPFKGMLQGNFKCDLAGVTCTSFGYPLS